MARRRPRTTRHRAGGDRVTDVLLMEIGQRESPRSHDGRLWFADWIAHVVVDGRRNTYVK
jgi:hypothetical protein